MSFDRLIFRSTGDPDEQVKLESVAALDIPDGHLHLELLAAPINPSDINFIQGVYGIKPECPSTIGFEGVARVVGIPEGCETTVGALVMPLKSFHTWQKQATCLPEECIPLPANIDAIQASMLSINPMTALRLISDFAELETDDWIVQNAANSGVGFSVVQLAKALGYRTINVVRREECRQPLLNAGADVVLLEGESLISDLKATVGPKGAKLCLNAVGGESALALAKVLANGGHHVTFGAMSKRPITLPNGVLIFKQPHFHGFWLTRWIDDTPVEIVRREYTRLADIVADGKLSQPVDQLYPLFEYKKAISRAQESQRDGKVILKIDD
ncbi:MAG: 2-enoyl thioester reductase domain-containing protein [Verrucomicrobiota bacterium]